MEQCHWRMRKRSKELLPSARYLVTSSLQVGRERERERERESAGFHTEILVGGGRARPESGGGCAFSINFDRFLKKKITVYLSKLV